MHLNSSWLHCLLWLSFACFFLLWLALACFGLLWLLWLLWLLALSVPLLLRFCFLLAHFSHFFALVAHFFDFLARLKPSCVFLSIFFDFGWIFRGFGRGLGRILGGFFDDFLRFCRKMRNGVEGHETLRGRMNFKGRLLRKHAHFAKKRHKIDANFRYEIDGPKKPLKIVFGRVLDSIWEGLKEALGGIWSLLGSLGPFLALTFSCLFLEWSSKVLLEASGLDSGAIVKVFGRLLGMFWEEIGGLWLILGCSGLLWLALACFGLLWLALAGFGLL